MEEENKFIEHKKYGKIKLDVWIPVHTRIMKDNCKKGVIIKNTNYKIKFFNKIDKPFIIKNVKTNKLLNSDYIGNYSFSNDNITTKFSGINIALSSAFPNVSPHETIDHINDDPKDNRIYNLEWMSRSKNSRKGQIKSVKIINENGGRRGTMINMMKPDEEYPKDRSKATIIGTFRSINKCAYFLIEKGLVNADITDKKRIDSIASKIGRSIKNESLKAYKYFFEKCEDIELQKNDSKIEKWKKHPKYNNYLVSNMGRIKNIYDNILQPHQNRNNPKYKSIFINDSRHYIHKLVYETWCGEIKKNLVIMHDDKAPIYQDGSYRNYACDLTLGTQSQNVKDFHKHKNLEKKK
ncbi:MAG: hypothetical protein CMF62_00290 [Magnetococcales bacterium]|nr:hypothetical protein [Magnetococcales bacterium]